MDSDDEIFRLLFDDEEEQSKAENILDEEYIDYDYDSGDRMMTNAEGVEALNDNEILFDIVSSY